MRILIAPDSFKGTFSAKEIANEILQALPAAYQANARIQPLADGGEGTVDVLADALCATRQTQKVTGPLGESVYALFALAGDMVLIEMASAAGLPLVPEGRLDPARATTYGVGELILHSLQSGVKKIVLGLGGSATVDGGAGALQSLGVNLLDKNGKEVSRGNSGLEELTQVDLSSAITKISCCGITLATDVTNPLLGEKGAVRVFGPQKGVKASEIETFEARLERYANLLEATAGKSLRDIPGCGAAGGLAFGLLAIGGHIVPGFELVSQVVSLESQIQNADLVITGEGKFDNTSLSGKVVGNMIGLCKKYQVRCWIVSGLSDFGEADLKSLGVEKIIPLFPQPEKDLLMLKKQTVPRLRELLSCAF